MKSERIIGFICAAIMMVSCGTKKQAVSSTLPVEEKPAVPAWHTCVMQGAKATIILGDQKISANTTLQVVRDSMLVISVMPLAGMEMARFEATPDRIVGINKLEGTYAVASYEELNRKIIPAVSWDTLQQLCSAELPTGSDQGRLVYTLGKQIVEITVEYPARKLDVPVRIHHLRTDRYKKVDISKWL